MSATRLSDTDYALSRLTDKQRARVASIRVDVMSGTPDPKLKPSLRGDVVVAFRGTKAFLVSSDGRVEVGK